jgi:hypothetical protein
MSLIMQHLPFHEERERGGSEMPFCPFLGHAADPALTDRSGRTPLDLATDRGNGGDAEMLRLATARSTA